MPAGRKLNQLRIVGGKWRGRKLSFVDGPGLRPTTDRVRETLFNWLMPVINGARCLDLFAGSGALGMEALSRGAKQVVMLDNNPAVTSQLEDNLSLLDHPAARVIQADAPGWLQQAEPEPFDVVFLDPPYASNVLAGVISALAERQWLEHEAWIYMEFPSSDALPDLPDGWHWHRNRQAGQVGYHLVHYMSE